MSYIICDMDCDLEINKSVLEEHCSDCLCEPGGVPQSVPASKAWRSTSVVGERHPAQSLPNLVILVSIYRDKSYMLGTDL